MEEIEGSSFLKICVWQTLPPPPPLKRTQLTILATFGRRVQPGSWHFYERRKVSRKIDNSTSCSVGHQPANKTASPSVRPSVRTYVNQNFCWIKFNTSTLNILSFFFSVFIRRRRRTHAPAEKRRTLGCLLGKRLWIFSGQVFSRSSLRPLQPLHLPNFPHSLTPNYAHPSISM